MNEVIKWQYQQSTGIWHSCVLSILLCQRYCRFPPLRNGLKLEWATNIKKLSHMLAGPVVERQKASCLDLRAWFTSEIRFPERGSPARCPCEGRDVRDHLQQGRPSPLHADLHGRDVHGARGTRDHLYPHAEGCPQTRFWCQSQAACACVPPATAMAQGRVRVGHHCNCIYIGRVRLVGHHCNCIYIAPNPGHRPGFKYFILFFCV